MREHHLEATVLGAVFETSARSLDSIRTARVGASRLRQVASQWNGASPEQLAGRMAEELHASSFNVNAASKGFRSLKATTGAANGAGTAAADITITNAGRVVSHAQVKFHGAPPATTFNVADRKYNGMQRIVPSDQVDQVRKIAEKRGLDGLGQRNYPDVANSASDRVRLGGVKSKPLSRDKALSAAKNSEKAAHRHVGVQMVGAVKNGAFTGVSIGGGFSVVSNISAYCKGSKSGKEAVVDTAKDAAACGLSGAAVSGAAVAAESVLIRVGARTLARGSAPVAIGLTAVDIGKDVGRLAKGDINGGEFTKRAAGSVAKGGCTWGGMQGGAAVGTFICPGVGTVVGGIVGGIAAGLFGSWLFG